MRVITYIPSRRTPLIFFPVDRLPVEDVYIAPATYKIRKDMASERLEQMFAYAEVGDECRSVWLRRYFGEPESDLAPCGVCDVCLSRRKRDRAAVAPEEIAAAVREGLAKGGGLTVKELVRGFETEPSDVLTALDSLVAARRVTIDPTGIIRMKSV
jgi:ATP-dependent DNA helicase RecQ